MTQQIHICSDYIGLRFNAFISHVIGHILARSNSYPEWGLSNFYFACYRSYSGPQQQLSWM